MRTLLRRHGPLILLIAIECAWSVYFTVTRAIPRGHDGFQYLYLKFYFYNEFVTGGDVAQWMPYLSHGSPGAWWYIVQSGIFDWPLFAAARALGVSYFLPVFYALVFLEKLLLLIGTWLLTGVHMRSRTARFIATASVAMTSIWFTGVWWNFHAMLALPAMLYLLHRTLAEFEWRWLAGLSLLLFLQTFGQLSYLLPMTLFYLAAYAVLMLIRPEVRSVLRDRFRFQFTGAAAVILVNAAFLVELLWLRRASREIAFPASQRGADGRIPLEMFLTHGGNMDLRPWTEFFSGLSPHLDFTMFAGFSIAALVIAGLWAGPLNRGQKLFGGLALLTILVGTASPLAVFIYYFWPLGSLFRHLTLVMPVAKMFCALMAGCTADRLTAADQSADGSSRRGMAVGIVIVALGGWIVLLTWFGVNDEARQEFIRALTGFSLPAVDDYAKLVGARFPLRGALFASLSLVAVVALLRTRFRTAASATWILPAVLVADIVTYNGQEVRTRMLTLSPREAELFTVTDLPFAERRSPSTDDLSNPRRRTFSKPAASLIGTRYWAESLLWFTDAYGSDRFTGLWSVEFDALLGALRKRPGLAGIGLQEALVLPTDDPLVTTIGGFSERKVRFFDRAMVCPSSTETAEILQDPAYGGQFALLTANDSPNFSGTRLPCESGRIPSSPAEAIDGASYKNTVFTSNRAEFDVDNSTGRPLVMTYSDSWSRHWSAEVNSASVPVIRANLAYKAVVIPAGRSHVAFAYRDRMGSLVIASQVAASFGLLVWSAYLARRTFRVS